MQLLGQPITHTTFGKGIVTDWNDHSITVCFNSGEKRFIYPDAFSNFLILKNTDAQEKIQHLIDESEENHKAKLHVPFDSVPRRGIGGYLLQQRILSDMKTQKSDSSVLTGNSQTPDLYLRREQGK